MSDDTDQRASKRARVDNDDAGQPEPSASKPVAESANGQPAEAKHVNGDTAEKLEAVDEEDDEDDDPYGLNEASNGQSGDSAAPAGDLYLDTASFAETNAIETLQANVDVCRSTGTCWTSTLRDSAQSAYPTSTFMPVSFAESTTKVAASHHTPMRILYTRIITSL